jgi:hypothetical protein
MHSTTTANSNLTANRVKGTLRWQAPELLPDMLGNSFTEPRNTKATDVYAFAVVGYEARIHRITILGNPH